jgi:hypothetical protein
MFKAQPHRNCCASRQRLRTRAFAVRRDSAPAEPHGERILSVAALKDFVSEYGGIYPKLYIKCP